MGNFLKRQEHEAAGTQWKISKVNVLETVNHVDASQIDVRFAAAATLSRALKEKKVSQLQTGIQERMCNNTCHYCLQDRKVLFSTMLLGSLHVWIQEFWCQSQKVL